MNAPPTFTLPEIPPRPPLEPPADPAQHVAWAKAWDIHQWATEMHSEHACRESAAETRRVFTNAGISVFDGIERAILASKRVSKADVVLACIRAVPPTVRPTENGWAGDVMLLANELWADMQADPVINPPPAPAGE